MYTLPVTEFDYSTCLRGKMPMYSKSRKYFFYLRMNYFALDSAIFIKLNLSINYRSVKIIIFRVLSSTSQVIIILPGGKVELSLLEVMQHVDLISICWFSQEISYEKFRYTNISEDNSQDLHFFASGQCVEEWMSESNFHPRYAVH